MLTPQRVNQLVRKGHIPKPEHHGQYRLAPVVQGYVRYLQERPAQKPTNGKDRIEEPQIRQKANKPASLEELDIAALTAELNSLPAPSEVDND